MVSLDQRKESAQSEGTKDIIGFLIGKSDPCFKIPLCFSTISSYSSKCIKHEESAGYSDRLYLGET